MDIVFFTHYFAPEGNAPANRTYDHCVRWAKEGANVTVITCAPNVPSGVVYEGYRNRFWPQRETIDGIEVIRVWTFIAPNSGGLRRILNYLTYLISAVFAYVFFCRRPNLVVATSPQFFCGWAGTIASILKWTPFVLEIRDIWPESIIAVGAMRRGLTTSLLEVLEKWMYLSATRIVTVGQGYKDAVLRRVPKLKNVSVITNGVDFNRFIPQPANQEFLERWNLQGKFVCSYVGTIGMAHGLEVVLQAAEILREKGREDIKFCLVGDGANRKKLEQQAEKLGVQNMVEFTGRLDKEQMSPVLASSNATLIHLRQCELFTTVIPSKVFESMAMARPIIMGVDGEAREIVNASESGLDMRPGNPHDLVKCVCELADNPQLTEQLSRQGRIYVAENFTRDILAARYLSLLAKIVNREVVDEKRVPVGSESEIGV